jgi:hypothetical protein
VLVLHLAAGHWPGQTLSELCEILSALAVDFSWRIARAIQKNLDLYDRRISFACSRASFAELCVIDGVGSDSLCNRREHAEQDGYQGNVAKEQGPIDRLIEWQTSPALAGRARL